MCIFCKIINQEIPAYKIYEDNLVIAFLDVNPKANGHTLIIPKKHYVCLEDIDLNTLSHLHQTSQKIYQLLNNKLNPDGCTLVQNNGAPQEVKHYHLHIIPKYQENKLETVANIYQKIVN